MMSTEERILINHVVSRLFGQLRKYPISEEERDMVVQKVLQSKARRERLKQLSEIPLEQLDEASRHWLQGVLGSEC